MNPYSATPDGYVLSAYEAKKLHTVEASVEAARLHKDGKREQAALLRAATRQAQVNKNIRAEA